MNTNNKKFTALRDKWYKKLANQGFKDIETVDGMIKRPTSVDTSMLYMDPIKVETKQAYFQLAGQFFHDHKFADPVEKVIWAYHSDGMSIRNIVKELKSRGIAAYRTKVHSIVKRLSSKMLNRTEKKNV